MEIVFMIIGIAALLFLLSTYFKQPKHQRVYEYIEELYHIHGYTMDTIESEIQRVFELSEHQARLCVNHMGDKAWFEMQSFLED